MHLTIKERVELVLMSGADGTTNRSVAKKFNRIYPDREPISHTTVGLMSKSGSVVRTLEESCFGPILLQRDSDRRGVFKNATK